jgi:PAS domain-containing protein
MSLPELFFILMSALVCTTVGLFIFGRAKVPANPFINSTTEADISLLFKGERLQHASTAGFKLADFNENGNDWATLRTSLAARFPNFPSQPGDNTNTVVIQAHHSADIAKLEIRKIDDCTHIQIIDQETLPLDVQHKIKSLEAEALVTGFAGSTAPHPIWQVNSDGTIGWYNTAYHALYQTVFAEDPKKEQPLFVVPDQSTNPLSSTRASVTSAKDDRTLWFDISSVKTDVGIMCHAIDINAVISAEIAQRNFVQTLAKTFAQLSTGLAIFDRNSQLALFNPALVDLSALPIEFLSSRPDLLSFFDRLRDSRVMPEPKNYHSWRQEIAEVIAAATDGRYQETWSLDTGQTYRVSGRPHPDGAIAFLIEDISAEVSLARSFRSELAIGQSMMNTFDFGLAVFASTGVLQFSNASYRNMWKLDPENTFIDVTISDCIKDWQKQSQPNPAWADIRDYVMKIGERDQWDCRMSWKDGSEFDCVIKPIALGATMLLFERVASNNSRLLEKQLLLSE